MLQKATIWERSSFQEPKDACHVCLFIHPVTLPILPNLSQESRMYFCILLYFVYIYPVPTLPILSPGPSVSWTEKKQEPERSLERGRSKYQFVFDVKKSKMFKTINSTACPIVCLDEKTGVHSSKTIALELWPWASKYHPMVLTINQVVDHPPWSFGQP